MLRDDDPPRLPRLPHALVGVTLVTATLGVTALSSAQQGIVRPDDGAAFGYRLNEERRYILEPGESLAGGEVAEWWIRFRGVDREADPPVADFEFGHERLEIIDGQWNPAEELMSVRVEGRLQVNLDGFPLRLDFEQRFGHRGETMAGDSLRRIRFTFDDGRYRKDMKFGTRDWDFDIGLPRYGTLEPEVPRGLYTWLPSALQCLGSSRGTCVEVDPAFANPGFLSLAMPVLFEQIDPDAEQEDVERKFVFFTPGVIGASPFRPVAPGRWISRERDSMNNLRRYFVEWKLELGASRDIEVGPRTLHSWEVKMGGGIDRIYVEPDGRILRIDLESTWDNPDDRWIRLLFPSEDFTSPNPDPIRR